MPDQSTPQVSAGPPLKRTPRWRRELRILRTNGLRSWWRGLRALRRYNRSVARMVREEGPDHA